MKSKRIPNVKQKEPAAEAPRRGWDPVVLACVALCGLVLASYWNSLDHGFVWDDHEQVVMNPYLKPDAAWTSLFTADVRFSRQDQAESTKVYRPLQLVTYRLVSGLADGGAMAFHACNLAFAMAGALAAFWVFWLLTRRVGLAFAGAALFAVHPVHTEAVDWIAALPDLGVGLLALVAFGLFVSGRRRFSLAAFGVALLWKETAVVLPLSIVCYAWITEGGAGSRARRAFAASGPYWAVLAVYLAVRATVLGGLAAGGRDWALTPVESALTMAQMMVSYLGKLALPVGLNAYQVFHPVRSAGDAGGWLASVAVIAGVAGIVGLVRWAPLYGFAAIWVVAFLIPAMNFGGLGRNPFAERYLFLPSAGFCLLVAMIAASLLRRLPVRSQAYAGMALLAVTLAICVAETSVRNLVWRDDATLWRETLRVSPDAPFVRLMVASAAGADPNAAERDYLKAIELAQNQTTPDRLYTLKGYEGLASLYADRGLFDKAMEALTTARVLAPNDPDVTAEEGLVLARMGRAEGSEDALNRALAVHPNNENLLAALGLIARDEHHDLKRAADLFAKALAVHTQQDDFSASQHNNLAAVYGDQDNYASAIAELQQAIRILPTDPEFHVNLASALAATGRFAEARAEAAAALKIAPNDPNAQDVLARLNQVR